MQHQSNRMVQALMQKYVELKSTPLVADRIPDLPVMTAASDDSFSPPKVESPHLTPSGSALVPPTPHSSLGHDASSKSPTLVAPIMEIAMQVERAAVDVMTPTSVEATCECSSGRIPDNVE